MCVCSRNRSFYRPSYTLDIIFVMSAWNNYSVSQKKLPLRFSDIFFPNGWEFLTNFYTPIIRFFLDKMSNFYSIISNFDEVIPY